MKISFVLAALCLTTTAFAESPKKILVAPGTLTATSATVVWDKPVNSADIASYHLIVNKKDIAMSTRCNFRFKNLSPLTNYTCEISAEGKDGKFRPTGLMVKFKTTAQGKILNVLTFGAKGDGTTLNTKAIQAAIDVCPAGGTVLIPSGTFISGALYLKSKMTLDIARGATLKGSTNDADYLPFYKNRFEGWELETYASLLNAGKMNSKGGYVVEQLTIRGEGTLSGGGDPLGKAMIAKSGLRGRGRLICLMNCRNVDIQGLTIKDSPCWTIHYIYSKGVSCHDLNITSTLLNGDGIDPDSSDDSYIFNCSFLTGDDCIAIKSGKNPEGDKIARPTTNVRITDCDFLAGHGISIGSEMSGGVDGVLVQDCKTGSLLYGMQIKGTKERGGYVRNVTVADCQLLRITIYSKLGYNNDGAAAAAEPMFEHFTFRNIDLSRANLRQSVMDLNGFKQAGHQLNDVTFENIIMPKDGRIVIKDATNLKFINVLATDGSKPNYEITDGSNIANR
ncbi:glycosyl hydrolase family 28 protein [Mucilaginibacter calamicampi]|uniref:Glycosyl hydrolase family 28 protein n=1 Tax=Mucilaginibacter calamicampi TaxID=1302352 RepID=A0ABW2YU23_9SPHI